MLIIGIDISTAVTAYTLINTELPLCDSVIKFEGIHLSKFKTLYDKAEEIKRTFLAISKEHKIEKIYVEEALQSFRRGLSSAKTLSTLAKFNGIVCYLAEDIFEEPVDLVNVIHARSKLGIKLDRKTDVNVKDQVLLWAKNQKSLEKIHWPTKTMKSGPRKGLTVDDKSCYDIADSSIMALYGLAQTYT